MDVRRFGERIGVRLRVLHQTRNPNCYQLGFFIACVPRYRPCAARVYGLRAFLNLGLIKANIL
jgi:hypothetical protein